ncbi:Olfactory receptor 4B1, partial [Galemys pyrenaicus]
ARTNNVTEFIIVGLFQDPQVQRVCFVLFLPVYLATVLGNGLIVLTITISKSLNSPMYFFLNYLSLVEICYSSTIVPKFIRDLLAKIKTISLEGCLTQLFFFHFLGVTEIFLLTVMAYDRYVAICKPLQYTTIMSRPVCHLLVAGSWLGGLVHSMVQIFVTVQLPFCGPNVIDHYFCDLHPLFKLACTDTSVQGVVVLANSGLFSVFSFLFLVASYIVILFHLRNHSAEGRRKALSTCASHITVVLLFFGPAIFLYMRPSSTFTKDKLVAVFYTVITPMLNPIIYTLRNKEIHHLQATSMARKNNVTELILTGLFQDPQVQRVCFVLFLPVYLATIVGNGLIVLTVAISKSLNSPMYFFLSYLSLVEISYSSTVVPKFIRDLLAKIKTISLEGCMAQIFFFHFFGVAEILLLVVMAYDRYVAICKPLQYTTIMSRQLCHVLVAGSWFGGFLHSIVQILIAIQLPFCGPNVVDHYFCDLLPLFKLACKDTFVEGVSVLANSGLISLCSFLILMISYIVILFHLRNHSAEGRRKALSTCASHITVVFLFFGPAIFLYLRPSSTFTEDKLVAMFYTVFTPMLNPIIYTLRNKEMKIALRKLWCKKVFSGME